VDIESAMRSATKVRICAMPVEVKEAGHGVWIEGSDVNYVSQLFFPLFAEEDA
jgi:hypothetical protein